MRYYTFLGATAVAITAGIFLLVGWFLTAQPPLIGEETASLIRTPCSIILGLSALVAALTAKREWLEALRPR